MSGGNFDPDWSARVTVPVKRVGGHWEFFYGGDVPVREGTLAELTLSANQITDDVFRRRVMQELTQKILDEGTELRVALSDLSVEGRAGTWPETYPKGLPPRTTRFESVVLGPVKRKHNELLLDPEFERGGLWLKLKGLERSELLASTVQMPPGFPTPVAATLNHALTMLSQQFEKHRISNTGNVYSRVFYQDRDTGWYPLDDLRTGVVAAGERKLLADLWAEVEHKLGWRPVPVTKKKRA